MRLAKIDHKLRRMDSDAQFSDAAGSRAGVRTIGETVINHLYLSLCF